MIEEIKKIEEFNLNYCQIEKINGLEKLIEKLPKLKVVDLSYNPLTEESIQEIKQIQRNHSKIDIRIN